MDTTRTGIRGLAGISGKNFLPLAGKSYTPEFPCSHPVGGNPNIGIGFRLTGQPPLSDDTLFRSRKLGLAAPTGSPHGRWLRVDSSGTLTETRSAVAPAAALRHTIAPVSDWGEGVIGSIADFGTESRDFSSSAERQQEAGKSKLKGGQLKGGLPGYPETNTLGSMGLYSVKQTSTT